ncbi:glycosyltransferase [Flavobacterium luminosum]|uniref:Glycosyltransferase n=1 Tax=Flavobacterium luminosum TaxID=2949086 RepID=A0ABT0TLZ5_9FLAO|nr:glycosyltransferase [Flavobacterium sp. HXWNR70]MCL9808511.1 glycosyltransferase [Flavobacterium sp. HXWNR70]
MQNYPLVSVICLCYNHGKYVLESLNSVLNQSYPNVELIIGDDASTDNSVTVISEWLKDHPTIPFVFNQTNLGNTKTFNKLLQLSKGDYIIDLAADDLLQKDCISELINTFYTSSYKNLKIVYGNAELINEKGQHLGFYYNQPAPSGDLYESIVGQYNKICTPASMVKRSLLDELGGYNENLAYEDLDLWIRTSRKYPIQYLDKVVVKKRELENSLGNSFFANKKRSHKINTSTYRILKNVFSLNKSKSEHQALLRRIHSQIKLTFELKDFSLLLKLILLKFRVHLKLTNLIFSEIFFSRNKQSTSTHTKNS